MIWVDAVFFVIYLLVLATCHGRELSWFGPLQRLWFTSGMVLALLFVVEDLGYSRVPDWAILVQLLFVILGAGDLFLRTAPTKEG